MLSVDAIDLAVDGSGSSSLLRASATTNGSSNIGHGSTLRPRSENISPAASLAATSICAGNSVLKPHAARRRSILLKRRLEFSSLGLYERKHQLAQLRDAYLRVRHGSDHHGPGIQMVLIKGRSGTGKSAVVQTFRDQIVLEQKNNKHAIPAFFASGKFEQHRGLAEPYSAVAAALSQLCNDIVRLEQEDRDRDAKGETIEENSTSSARRRLSNSIQEAVGPSEGPILVRIMPNLKRVLGEVGGDTDYGDGDSIGSDPDSSYFGPRARNRFDYAMRRFTRAACSPSRPLVLFLDDLQWADAASLELLHTLASDRELRGLLFIGCYRDDEVDERTHPLAVALHEIEKQRRGEPVITRIAMSNLAMDTVSEFLSDLLCSDEQATLALKEIVYKKTNGNAYFVKQYLESLCDNNLLYYSYAKSGWEWNVDRIRAETSVAGNVADLMRDKLQKNLSEFDRDILRIASCLGSTFTEATIALVAENVLKRLVEEGQVKAVELDRAVVPGERTYGEAVSHCLDTCVYEGLLDTEVEKADGLLEYRFVHDQVQLAAFFLTPEDERDVLQLHVGLALVENLSSAEFNKVMFVAADLLDKGMAHLPPTKTIFLAELNLQAGKKAMKVSAYVAAANYFKAGVSLLGPDHWEEYYSLSLNLYCLLAEAEYSSGHVTEMNMYVDEVLAQKERPFLDKFRAYAIHLKSLVHQAKFHETEDASLYVLAQMGVKFPNYGRKVAFLPALIRTKLLLSRKPTNTLIDLPIMQDRYKIKAISIMDFLATAALLSDSDILPLVILKMMRWTVKYGICKYSPVVFCSYGFLLCSALGEVKQGHEFGKLALEVLEKVSAKDEEANILASIHFLIDHWTVPVQLSLNPLLRGYQAGMESGDVERGFYCIVFYCNYSFISGRPLTSIEEDLRSYTGQIREYQQQSALSMGLVQWQLVLNLLGRSVCPTVLTGEAMDQELSLTQADETKNTMIRDYIKSYQLWLAYYFGDYDLAGRLVEELRDFVTTRATFVVWRNGFFEALTLFALARRDDTRKWKRRARKVMKRIRLWTEQGNVNCLHMVSLFEAEMAAFEGKADEAKAAYEKAISIAARHGLSHDRALANELAGEFFLEGGDMFWATHYLGSAYQLYMDWEAFAKANHLLEKHASLLSALELVTKPQLPDKEAGTLHQ